MGAAAAYLLGRYAFRTAVEKTTAKTPKFAAIDKAIGKNGWKIVALLRLSPVVPFNLSNYFFGLTAIRFLPPDWPHNPDTHTKAFPATYIAS